MVRTVIKYNQILDVKKMGQLVYGVQNLSFFMLQTIDQVLHMQHFQNSLKTNILFLHFDIIGGILAQCVVCGECQNSYTQTICKFVNLSAVCGIKPDVSHIHGSQ